MIYSIQEKTHLRLLLLSIAFACFFLFKVFVYKIKFEFLGTNPLTFFQLIDYPFFGFFKSFSNLDISSSKSMTKELIKVILFFMTISLSLMLINIKKKNVFFYIPIFFTIVTLSLAEVGYWLNFDNISRMLTAMVAWVIILKNEDLDFKDYYFFKGIYIILFFLLLKYFFSVPQLDYFLYSP